MTTNPHVLLVEDDPGDVRLAMSVLQKLNLQNQAVVVGDGEEAMDWLLMRGKYGQHGRGVPSFILLDLKLPRVNGFDLLRQIKSDSRLKYIPVVVLTSSHQERDVELAYRLGANGYVVKSIDFAAYMATLRAVASYWIGANQPPPMLSQFRSKPSYDAAIETCCGVFKSSYELWSRSFELVRKTLQPQPLLLKSPGAST